MYQLLYRLFDMSVRFKRNDAALAGKFLYIVIVQCNNMFPLALRFRNLILVHFLLQLIKPAHDIGNLHFTEIHRLQQFRVRIADSPALRNILIDYP